MKFTNFHVQCSSNILITSLSIKHTIWYQFFLRCSTKMHCLSFKCFKINHLDNFTTAYSKFNTTYSKFLLTISICHWFSKHYFSILQFLFLCSFLFVCTSTKDLIFLKLIQSVTRSSHWLPNPPSNRRKVMKRG